MKPTVCKHCGAIDSHYSFQCALVKKPILPKVGDIIEYNYTTFNGEVERHSGRIVSITPSNKPRKETKKSKPINKVSDKMKVRLRLYMKVREAYLDGHIGCEAQLSVCNGTATEIHHKAGKTGDLLFDDQYFLAVCRTCHSWIELNPKEAKKKGLSIDRLNK